MTALAFRNTECKLRLRRGLLPQFKILAMQEWVIITYAGTVFDNTVMMIMSEHADGANHANVNAGIHVVAGDNTGINTGHGLDANGRGSADLQFELTRAFNMGYGGFGNSCGTSGIGGFYS